MSHDHVDLRLSVQSTWVIKRKQKADNLSKSAALPQPTQFLFVHARLVSSNPLTAGRSYLDLSNTQRLSGQVWSGFSRIELAEINVEKSGNVFRRLSSPVQIVKMEDFKDIPDFNYDPYKISNQTGFHTINFDEDLR